MYGKDGIDKLHMQYVFYLHIYKMYWGDVMKTTVFIDDQLLHEAMQAIGARTKREAILAGLKALVLAKNRELFRKELGTFDLDLDLKKLEELRHAD